MADRRAATGQSGIRTVRRGMAARSAPFWLSAAWRAATAPDRAGLAGQASSDRLRRGRQERVPYRPVGTRAAPAAGRCRGGADGLPQRGETTRARGEGSWP